jgi:hypothetical protein
MKLMVPYLVATFLLSLQARATADDLPALPGAISTPSALVARGPVQLPPRPERDRPVLLALNADGDLTLSETKVGGFAIEPRAACHSSIREKPRSVCRISDAALPTPQSLCARLQI